MANAENKRLLITLPSLGHGGAERVASELVIRFAQQKTNVCVVTIADSKTDYYQLPEGVERRALNLQSTSTNFIAAFIANMRRVRALRQTILAFRPDAILSFTGRTNVLASIATIGVHARLVVSERIYPPTMPLGNVWDWLRRHLYVRADVVIAQTDRAAGWLEIHTNAKTIHVIPNPLWTTLQQNGPLVSPAEYVESGEKLLLAAGRLTTQKGFDMLLDAFGRIAKSHPRWRLVILGEGEMRQHLEQHSQHLNVRFPGVVGNIQQWYERADLFVLSSRYEGFPNVLLEALACGTPAIGFDCPAGVNELIDDTHNGLIVPADDVQALAQALDLAMKNDEMRLRFAANANASVLKYSEETIVESWREVLYL